jgi:hypothetical protein
MQPRPRRAFIRDNARLRAQDEDYDSEEDENDEGDEDDTDDEEEDDQEGAWQVKRAAGAAGSLTLYG